MNGAELIVHYLENQGVHYIFGVPGDIETNIAAALKKSGIRFITARNEKSAAFMADIYSRVSGKAGVCFSTVGPGATNLVSGLANATQDRSSVIAISDQMPRKEMFLGSHQYVDFDRLFHPTTGVTKWNTTVHSIDDVVSSFARGFEEACKEPRGAVHLGIPVDIFNETGTYQAPQQTDHTYPLPQQEAIEQIYQRIRTGKGIIVAGPTIKRTHAQEAFKQFVEQSKLPVLTSFMGKGALDERNPNSLGTISRHLQGVFSEVFNTADFILTIGYDTIEGVRPETFGNLEKVVNIDLTDNTVPTFFEPTHNLFGDIKYILTTLTEKSYDRKQPETAPLRQKIREAIYGKLDMEVYPPRPHKIMEAINTTYGNDSVIVCDVGLNKYYAGLLLEARDSNQIIFSNGMSSMAFSSGAMGAKLAAPKKDVLVICGDGGFLMDPQEISTCVRYNQPLTVVILNNSGLGLVEKKQQKDFKDTYEVNFGSPDYVQFAEAFGARGHTIRSWGQLTDVLEETRGNKQINIVEIPVNYTEGL
ncbi:MAG: thiamine pyrophosphate-binding protein [Nanoarchaeota archaeon]|nr:thiamine pyrophosphate-binding protein [Nanoarchaeota archaeon]